MLREKLHGRSGQPGESRHENHAKAMGFYQEVTENQESCHWERHLLGRDFRSRRVRLGRFVRRPVAEQVREQA